MTSEDGRVQPVVGTGAAKAVWDSSDEIGSAVAFVRDHGDDLVALAGRIPQLLASTGQALAEAAADARVAASFLTGGATAAERGVKALSGLAGDALDECRHELSSAREMLEHLAVELEGLPVPNITPKFSKIMGRQIVTGLDFGDGNMLGPASARLKEGSARFDGVGDQLAAVAGYLRSIGELVDRAGEGLGRAADQLASSSDALTRFTEPH